MERQAIQPSEPLPPPPPTYAENLLYHAGFEFQHRNSGERLNLDRISAVNIPAIIRNVDTELLASFLEEVTYSEISEEDLRLYSDDTFVRLFQLCQLIIEYLVDAQDTLSANLNGLAKKYAAKKRELERLSKNLAKADVEVATLKDELYYNTQCMRESIASKAALEVKDGEGVVSRIDPSKFPSQERRPTAMLAPASLEDISSTESSKSQEDDGSIILHIVSSKHGLYLQMNVEDSTTVRNLKNKIIGRLLLAGNYNISFEEYVLLHKEEELAKSSRTLKEHQIGNDAALVIVPRPTEKMDASVDTSDVPSVVAEASEAAPSPASPKTTNNYSNIESKLQELTSVAVKAQEELIEATRSLQFQVSMQESNKEAFAEEVGKQLKLLHETLHEEVNQRVTHAIIEHERKLDASKEAMSPLSKLNMGELVETDHDLDDENIGDSEDISVIKRESPSKDESANDPSAVAREEKGKHIELPLKINTNISVEEVYEREVSPFNPPSAIEVTSELTEDSPPEKTTVTTDAIADENATLRDSMRYSASTGTRLGSSNSTIDEDDVIEEDRTPTPSKGYLDRKIPPVKGEGAAISAISPSSHWSNTAVTSSDRKRQNDVRQFRFSDDSVRGIADIIDFPDDYDNSDAIDDSISDKKVLQITSKGLMKSMDSTDDMQSIEISHSEFVSGVYAEDEAVDDGRNAKKDGKKKRRFGGRRISIKKMLPKWKKSGISRNEKQSKELDVRDIAEI